MRNKITLIILTLCIIMCHSALYKSFANKKEKEIIVTIKTDLGVIKLKLYNNTPKHRDNFIKLANDGFYNDVLFHRVIKGFMIQTGDPDSKKAESGVMLGNGGPGYNIPAEILSENFHKRGAIAAARLGDDVNPEKESSGSQFYIVQGTVFTSDQIKQFDDRLRFQKKQDIFKDYLNLPENIEYKNQLDSLRKNKKNYEANVLIRELGSKLNDKYKEVDEQFFIPEEHQKIYTTIGGAPHLDGGYTVFGEVIKGMEIVDKIAEVEKDKYDRPLKDIKIISIKVSK